METHPDHQEHGLDLMKCIRFTLIPMHELQELLKSSFMCDNLGVKRMVEDALKYISLNVTERLKIESPKDQARGGLWLCVFGGFDKSQPNNGRHRFQVLLANRKLIPYPDKDSWIEMPELPQHFYDSSVVSARGHIFVCGGWNDVGLHLGDVPAIATCHVLDPVTWHWGKIASLKFPRADFCLVVHCGDLYAIGGSGPSQGLEPLIRAVERYSWNEDCWRVVTQLTPPVHSVECAASLGEHIYTYCVSVGRDHENSYVATLRCFDSKNDAWEELPSSDDKVWERGIYKMVTVQDCIFIAKVGSQYIRAYNPNTRQWHNFELFPFDQNRFSTLLSVEDRVYFLGNKDRYGSNSACSFIVPKFAPGKRVLLFPSPLPSLHGSLRGLPEPLCTAVAMPYHHIESAKQKQCCTWPPSFAMTLTLMRTYLLVALSLVVRSTSRFTHCENPFWKSMSVML